MRHELTHLHKPHPESLAESTVKPSKEDISSHSQEDATEPEQPAKKANKGDENCTSFCYETVLKEELIIEDELAAEDESERDSHDSVEDKQPTTDASSSSAKNQFKCTVCAKVSMARVILTLVWT